MSKTSPKIKSVSIQEFLQMMQRCSEEILSLRAQRNALAPKAEAYDLILKVMGLLPGKSQGYGEDVVWQLKKRIAELQSTLVKKD